MKWTDALKIWNDRKGKHAGQMWCVPKRGTPQHAEVMKIMRKDLPSAIIDEKGTLRQPTGALEAYDTKKRRKQEARAEASAQKSARAKGNIRRLMETAKYAGN
jgi:hypothetical protein